jgi:hypothetical protein
VKFMALALERGQQKWKPVLRPPALNFLMARRPGVEPASTSPDGAACDKAPPGKRHGRPGQSNAVRALCALQAVTGLPMVGPTGAH